MRRGWPGLDWEQGLSQEWGFSQERGLSQECGLSREQGLSWNKGSARSGGSAGSGGSARNGGAQPSSLVGQGQGHWELVIALGLSLSRMDRLTAPAVGWSEEHRSLRGTQGGSGHTQIPCGFLLPPDLLPCTCCPSS